MRRLFTVLFILIASAAYAEDVIDVIRNLITLDKVFIIPTDLQESQVLTFFEDFQKDYQSRYIDEQSEDNDCEDFVNMELKDVTIDSKKAYLRKYKFVGKCRILGFEYDEITLGFKDKIIKTIDMHAPYSNDLNVYFLSLFLHNRIHFQSTFPYIDKDTNMPSVVYNFKKYTNGDNSKRDIDIDFRIVALFHYKIEIGLYNGEADFKEFNDFE